MDRHSSLSRRLDQERVQHPLSAPFCIESPQQRLNLFPLPQIHFEFREYLAAETNLSPPGYSYSVPAQGRTSFRIPSLA